MTFGRALIALLVGAGLVPAANAHKTSDEETMTRFELTPFLGYQFGGAFDIRDSDRQADVQAHGMYALAFDLRADANLQYEFFYSRQPTKIDAGSGLSTTGLDVRYLHFGGTASFEEIFEEPHFLKPYTVGTIGVTQLSLDAADASDETPFSISAGVGLRVPVKPRFDIRLEARAFITFISSDSSIFCGSSGAGAGCVLRGTGSAFMQYAVLAGAAYSF